MIYGAADNNADGPILHFLQELRAAHADDPGIELLLFLDRSEGFSDDATCLGEDFTGARLYRLGQATAERLAGGKEFPEITKDSEFEPDSASPEYLRKFIAFCKHNYPAQRYGLMIYSHADGQAMCPDEDSGREMGIAELSTALTPDHAVDFLALELCNMAGVEIAYQWRPGNGGFSADVLLAIPNAGPPLDWARAFRRLRSTPEPTQMSTIDPLKMSAEEFGRLVIEEAAFGRQQHIDQHPQDAPFVNYEAAACLDLRVAGDVKDAIDDLAVALVETDGKEAFEDLRGPGSDGVVMNYARDAILQRPYVDVFDLCLRTSSCEELSDEVREAAQIAMDTVDDLVIASFGMPGYEHFTGGENGVFIHFPDGDALLGSTPVWRDCGWYTPHPAREGEGIFGRWSFLADNATEGNGEVENWFEMLDYWFDHDEGGKGGFNGYRW
jgi:clostripain